MSNAENISASILNISHSILTYVYDAIVFIDSASAEVVHWSLGANKLFEAGARNLKEFSSFENGDETDKRAVFIVNDLILDTCEQIIHDIISNSNFKNCVVITSVSQSLHQHLTSTATDVPQSTEPGEGNDFFKEVEAKLVAWMNQEGCHAEVVHIPLSFASVCSSLFLTPAFSEFWPFLTSDVPRLSKTITKSEKKDALTIDDLTLDLLPENRQIIIKKLVSTLSSLCEELEVNEEVYCLGATSRIVATELAGLQSAKARRKAAKQKASLLIVDRTLDLTATTGHHHDSFLDKVFALLPSLPGHKADVALDMSNFFSSHSGSDLKILPPGCLAHPKVASSRELLSTMITSRKQTDALIAVNRQLVETISKAKLPMDASVTKIGRVTADSLNAKLKLFRNNQDVLAKHSAIVQLSTACVQTLSHQQFAHQDDLASKEKLLIQKLGEDANDVVWNHMHNLMTEELNKEKPSLTVEEILLLWCFVVSLTGDQLTWTQAHQEDLKKKMVGLLRRDFKTSNIINELVTSDAQEGLESVADEIISRLQGLSTSRSNLQELSSILDTGSGTRPASYSPLLQQLINLTFDPNKPELVDLEFKSTGLRDLLKTGFRLFMNVSKPRPSDNPLLILFVIGGVTLSEVKLIKEAVNAKSSKTQVIVGSTQIAKAQNILRLLLAQDHLYPTQ
ncbi:putative sec1 family domain-containing protein 2 [Apostichopus japonicus]|uniref:Putative sec1 family domain-containing protein 2 n=1 Tax=Stichopus japonicus TaxID=307972 RepID=A0A2G8JSZ3_STIJA|nr:putative sec1 family domain-containing protein 2 [Apostichopus japonicus]